MKIVKYNNLLPQATWSYNTLKLRYISVFRTTSPSEPQGAGSIFQGVISRQLSHPCYLWSTMPDHPTEVFVPHTRRHLTKRGGLAWLRALTDQNDDTAMQLISLREIERRGKEGRRRWRKWAQIMIRMWKNRRKGIRRMWRERGASEEKEAAEGRSDEAEGGGEGGGGLGRGGLNASYTIRRQRWSIWTKAVSPWGRWRAQTADDDNDHHHDDGDDDDDDVDDANDASMLRDTQ